MYSSLAAILFNLSVFKFPFIFYFILPFQIVFLSFGLLVWLCVICTDIQILFPFCDRSSIFVLFFLLQGNSAIKWQSKKVIWNWFKNNGPINKSKWKENENNSYTFTFLDANKGKTFLHLYRLGYIETKYGPNIFEYRRRKHIIFEEKL